MSPSDRCGSGKNPLPQYAFKMSMFNVSAIHINSRSWLRSSSTHEPSDPPLRIVYFYEFVSLESVKREDALGGETGAETSTGVSG